MNNSTWSRKLDFRSTAVFVLVALLAGCGQDGETDHQSCGPGEGDCHDLVLVTTALTSPTGLLGATDLENAYGDVTSGGAGTTVAVISSYDNPNLEADLGTYRAYYNLPSCTTANGCFRKLNQNGNSSPLPAAAPDSRHSGELDLDPQMVSATCPKCNIVVIEVNGPNLSDYLIAEATATRLALFVSNSWGFPEWSGETGSEATFNVPGVSIFAASMDTAQATAYPAASAYVTAVGGTNLSPSTNSRGWLETVWSSSGSGCSAYIPKPAWQTGAGCSTRTIADVSAVAQNVAYYDSFRGGGWGSASGTSVASPIVAGLYAAASRFGVGPRYSYDSPAAFNDVTSGNNGSCSSSNPYLCNGEPGYDAPTGNGTPIASSLSLPDQLQTGVPCGNQTDPASTEVFIYFDATFQGQCRKLVAGFYPNSDVGIGGFGLPNDSISSIKVGSAVRAKLFHDADFNGSSTTFSGGGAFPTMPSGWNDQASSIRVEVNSRSTACNDLKTGEYALFADQNLGGDCVVLHYALNRPSPGSMGIANDTVSSLRTGPRVNCSSGNPQTLVLYENDNFNKQGGAQATFASGSGPVTSLPTFDNRASSTSTICFPGL